MKRRNLWQYSSLGVLLFGFFPINFQASIIDIPLIEVLTRNSIPSEIQTAPPESYINTIPSGGESYRKPPGKQNEDGLFDEKWNMNSFPDDEQFPLSPDSCPIDNKPEYVLPFPIGKEYYCVQCGGEGDKFSHTGIDSNAVDFLMKIGSKITAARSGQVAYVRDSTSDDDHELGKENLIIIKHLDGTYGRYMHITQNGAKVKAGQTVQQGDVIGLSGDSGYSTTPHLHFDVTQGCWAGKCQTLPLCFNNATDHPVQLMTGEFYRAGK